MEYILLYRKFNRPQCLADFVFQFVGFAEHLRKFSCKARHLLLERLSVVGLFFYANIATGREDVVLLGDVRSRFDRAKSFHIFERSVLKRGECVGEFLNVIVGKIAVLSVNHRAHFPRVDEKRLSFLRLVLRDEPERYGNRHAVEKLRRQCDDAFHKVGFYDALSDFAFASALG